MDMTEYQNVYTMNYLQYCDYLQDKYGIGLTDYMTKSYNKNPKCTRTKEGLLAHHKMEDRMIMLSTKEYAELCPYEWQQKQNIVYCDYLEHLLLHVLICVYPSKDNIGFDVGIGGVVNFLVPELNDLYSGWETKQAWRSNCHSKVKNDKDVYLAILKQFIDFEKTNPEFSIDMLTSSFNEQYGLWDSRNNAVIYREIKKMYGNGGIIKSLFKH